MKIIWEIAWKNIWRNKIRSSIILVAISLGLFGGVFTSSIIRGTFTQMVDKYRNIEVPDIQISKKGFIDNNEVVLYIPNTNQVKEEINTIPGIKDIITENTITGMISTAKAGLGIKILGVDSEESTRFYQLYKAIPDSLGTYLSKNTKNDIIISKTLSKKLNAKLKSKVVLTFQSLNGELVGGAFKVVGIFDTNSAIDETNVYVRNENIRDLIQMNSESAHTISLRVENQENLDAIKDQLVELLGDEYDVFTWKDLRPELGLMNEMMEMMSFLILTIILVALGFSIVNTMLMVVLERTQELGMLLAIGMGKTKVFCMVMLETVMLTIIGGTIGIVMSYVLIQITSQVGFTINLDDLTAIAGLDDVIYPQLLISDYVTTGVMVFITGLLASIFPSKRILKMNPSDSIKH